MNINLPDSIPPQLLEARDNPKVHVLVLLGLCCAVTFLWLAPVWHKTGTASTSLGTLQDELYGLRKLAGQIVALEQDLTDEQRANQSKTILKQVEDLAQETETFAAISNLSPVTIAEKKGVSMVFDDVALKNLVPFLHALAHRSLLTVQAIHLNRGGGKEGFVSARITVVESF